MHNVGGNIDYFFILIRFFLTVRRSVKTNFHCYADKLNKMDGGKLSIFPFVIVPCLYNFSYGIFRQKMGFELPINAKSILFNFIFDINVVLAVCD